MNLFASRLHKARTDNQMTQATLADYLGVSRQTINNYEAGIREPSLSLLTELAHILNVSVDWLLGNDTYGLFSNNPEVFTAAPIFSVRLEEVRSKHTLSQERLAEILKLPIAMYQRLEQGKLVPDIVLIDRISQYFQVSIDWLLGRDVMVSSEKLVPRKYLKEPYGNRLRERLILLRQLYHYDPEDVAYFLKIEKEDYIMFESGKCDPPVAIMLELSRLYKLPVESLTTENEYYTQEIKKRFL